MAYPTPEEAEDAFYAALREGDLDAMRVVWASHDGVVCVHPGGKPLLGHAEVMEGWVRILSGSALSVEAEVLTASMGANVAVHVVNERITDARGRPVAMLVATNVYEWSDEGWRMLLHHASQEPSDSGEPQRLH